MCVCVCVLVYILLTLFFLLLNIFKKYFFLEYNCYGQNKGLPKMSMEPVNV